MVFLILGFFFVILNVNYSWFPQQYEITIDTELLGGILLVLIGTIIIQTDKIIDQLENKEG